MDSAGAQIEGLPKADRERILNFIYLRLRYLSDPRRRGSPLEEPFEGLWRYRIGEYRIICTIEDAPMLVRVVRVGHRRDVYLSGHG